MGKDLIRIGQIVASVGLKGEVKIYSYAESEDRFLTISRLYVGEKQKKSLKGDRTGKKAEGKGAPADLGVHDIESVRFKGLTPIVKLSGIDDRDAADNVQFRYVYMDAEELPPLAEGEYYARDLIGLPVVTEEGTRVGVLTDVRTDTPQKLYVIEPDEEGKGEILLPCVPEFVLDKDPSKGRILVKLPKGLLEL